ncbi:acyl-CoA dehydrogenase [Pandoraea terrae]|uniref:Acyl-CoA dehydrogenase n=1 Tax=Pandoraea terrae TaxID=1537710 RepID=A0A5E4WZU7_9BURK|nr:MaoC family dehydratase N-terminal domain-containing protein [Pandoraea terrae]VVE29562.1 acyl-CoA dehydrogenase [Pandoraea terrae]
MNPHSSAPNDRAESAADVVALTSVAALNATLDYAEAPGTGDPLPHLWHWIFFRPTVRQSKIATDGHPEKGGFLPDLGLPRRMWAGGRLRFLCPLKIGAAITRESRILDVSEKEGRSGKLAFVTVKHQIFNADALAIEEEQDIVYREPAIPGAATPSPTAARTDELWHRAITPDEVLLFRYSALAFIGHRIHYDKPYAVEVEGYPNLVVHGPLIATLLIDLLRRFAPQATVLDFSFKAVRPSFMGNTLYLCARPSPDGKSVELWSRDHEGWLTMSALATLA